MFLITLEDVTRQYNWFCHAYCLMENHYLLLIDTPDGNLSMGMRQMVQYSMATLIILCIPI
jgi:REP element-mobilizing transposase RayT